MDITSSPPAPNSDNQFRLYTCDDGSYVFVTEYGAIGMEYNGHVYTRSIRGWMERVWGEDLGPITSTPNPTLTPPGFRCRACDEWCVSVFTKCLCLRRKEGDHA